MRYRFENTGFKAVAHGGDKGVFIVHVCQRLLCGSTQGDDRRTVLGTGSPPPFLVAAAQQRPEIANIGSLYRASVPQVSVDIDTAQALKMGVRLSDINTSIGAFLGGAYSLSDTAVKATPLLLCGLGCAVAFRMRLWNVGAEGQLLLGAWAATGVAV
mgnify:CR=1 FL=1